MSSSSLNRAMFILREVRTILGRADTFLKLRRGLLRGRLRGFEIHLLVEPAIRKSKGEERTREGRG